MKPSSSGTCLRSMTHASVRRAARAIIPIHRFLSFLVAIFYLLIDISKQGNMSTHITSSSIALVLIAAALIAFSGCSSSLSVVAPQGSMLGAPGLMVSTNEGGRLFFHDRQWKLTMSGIAGTADVTDADGSRYTADTTLSYFSAEAAQSSGRTSTMGQFMLTVLGVILVLGLAAIILYAAFLATDR
jgi:hypothetical protein